LQIQFRRLFHREQIRAVFFVILQIRRAQFQATLIEFSDHLYSDSNLIKILHASLFSVCVSTSNDGVFQSVVEILHDDSVRRLRKVEVELGCTIAKRSAKCHH
jgi:hypothetical protein